MNATGREQWPKYGFNSGHLMLQSHRFVYPVVCEAWRLALESRTSVLQVMGISAFSIALLIKWTSGGMADMRAHWKKHLLVLLGHKVRGQFHR